MTIFSKLLSNLWAYLADKKRCPRCRKWDPLELEWEIVDYLRPLSGGVWTMKQTFLCRGCGHEWKQRGLLIRPRIRM